jgi:electron-transferring-flavoprotein dehydrogenase
MEYDIVIVGAGPAGLACAIELKKEAEKSKQELSVCLLEKAASLGAHNLSGAVLEPHSLYNLIPTIKDHPDSPLTLNVKSDQFAYLTKKKRYKLPVPPSMHNPGNFIISVGKLCEFLGSEAEKLGVEIYPGFAAGEILYDDQGNVIGIETVPQGIDKSGNKKGNFEPGMQLLAKQTIFAEGCRGHLSERLIKRFSLRQNSQMQTYGLGVKEVWRVQESNPGEVFHSIGWPLDQKTYGGSFIYHLEDNKIAVGFVVGLDYQNPYLDVFQELQRFKTHPSIAPLFSDGERLSYGARALNEGGYQAIPTLTFPGGLIIGDAAGFLNVGKIKGIHNAIHSGQLAAQEIIQNLEKITTPVNLKHFNQTIEHSTISKELYQVRNLRPSFHYGTFLGLLYSGIDQYLFRGKAPWTLMNRVDNLSLKNKNTVKKINYPAPDNKLTFDKTQSLYLSGTFHEEDQPCHLKLQDPKLALSVNLKDYDSPETRYCPANVYEIIEENTGPRLQINAQNCLHCKTCDIKDPRQNIKWTAPEGGGGPQYQEM